MIRDSIAIIRGGVGHGYDNSLQSGAVLLRAVPERYAVHDILIDRAGQWHRDGVPMAPAQALSGVDKALLALSGEYADSGEVQRELELLAVPYTGASADDISLTMHKARTRFSIDGINGVLHPQHYMVREDDGDDYNAIARDIFRRFGPPYIVKPVNGSGSRGVRFVQNVTALPDALESIAREYGYPILVEHYIDGLELSVGVLEGMRDMPHYVLPAVAIHKQRGVHIFDTEQKRAHELVSIESPARLSRAQVRELRRIAILIHRALNLCHHSRLDLIINDRGVHFLEVNALPSFAEGSLMYTALESVGISPEELTEHLIQHD